MLENVMFFPEKKAPDKQLVLAKNDALENILSFPCCDGPPFLWTKCLFFFLRRWIVDGVGYFIMQGQEKGCPSV